MKPKMITRVTTTEFETDDGVIHDIPFELDEVRRIGRRKKSGSQHETRDLEWVLFGVDENYPR